MSQSKMSLDSKAEWKRFEERLDELRQSLTILNRCIGRLNISESARAEDRELVGTAIYKVFTSLIDFWIEAVKRLRAHKFGE